MHSGSNKDLERIRCHFQGVVQGVGFRPFIYRMAARHHLAGFVLNRPDGVIVEVEGPAESLEHFLRDVQGDLPPLAQVTSRAISSLPAVGEKAFQILASEREGRGDVHITPDMATCRNCLNEMFNPEDRRYQYPFINCTDCGPRLTIINDIPYDRANTAMACFPVCTPCLQEYEDPGNRRFHAEPNACPVCGPALSLLDENGDPIRTSTPLEDAAGALQKGAIIAVKGLGGFHLAVDAVQDDAVRRLRARKFREEKPLAIMVQDLEAAERLAVISEQEKSLLLSPERPIVLLKKKSGLNLLSPAVAPGMGTLGIMLPYTPIQHLLLSEGFTALVMTSGNQTDEPICIGNREAVSRLRDIADFFLIHNRDILVRCDDSIMAVVADTPRFLRRARGYAPKPVRLRQDYPDTLALGAQIKSTLCIVKGFYAFPSPHIGDLETPQARDFFYETIGVMERITERRPALVACDMHPAYFSTRAAQELKREKVVEVQHHHAHIVSSMAENLLSGAVIGLSMDGTGYGTDGQAWGGEFLIATETDFIRASHLRYIPLPGGEAAVREPWRMAASLLKEAFEADWKAWVENLKLVPAETIDILDQVLQRRIRSPLTSSLGRILDGVAALLGIRRRVSFEGQAAMELEALAEKGIGSPLPFRIIPSTHPSDTKHIDHEQPFPLILDLLPAVRAIAEAKQAGKDTADLAASFHVTLRDAFLEMVLRIREMTNLDRVAMSGGCFQNRILLEYCLSALTEAGFKVYHHHLVPTNDGGIALGQAVCAGARQLAE